MLRTLANILWLGLKELRSFQRDIVLVALVFYSFSLAIYSESTGMSHEVNNASIAVVDEDRSALSARILTGFYEPYFQPPVLIEADAVDAAMDAAEYMFVLDIPPNFEANVREGRDARVQVNIDATAMMQAGIGASYIQAIITDEVNRFARRSDADPVPLVDVTARMAFNPNLANEWHTSLISLISNVTLLTMVLTGAALIREREHGTIEHLLVMPLTSFEIMAAKVWANGLVILIAVAFCLFVVIEGALGVPVAGSRLLFLAGTVLYLFFATALGIFLATVARSMAQFALLVILALLPLNMLSGGDTPVESQPEWLQYITYFLPSRHYVSFSHAIVHRGAGIEIVWPEFLVVALLGLAFFVFSLSQFRRSIAAFR